MMDFNQTSLHPSLKAPEGWNNQGFLQKCPLDVTLQNMWPWIKQLWGGSSEVGQVRNNQAPHSPAACLLLLTFLSFQPHSPASGFCLAQEIAEDQGRRLVRERPLF